MSASFNTLFLKQLCTIVFIVTRSHKIQLMLKAMESTKRV